MVLRSNFGRASTRLLYKPTAKFVCCLLSLLKLLLNHFGKKLTTIAALQFPRGAATAWESSVALQLLLSTGLAGNGVLPSHISEAHVGRSRV
jgi:hypothetical protein